MQTLIALTAFLKATSLSRSSAYVLMRDDPDFPQPVKVGARRIAFVESEVNDWVASRIQQRDSKGGAQ